MREVEEKLFRVREECTHFTEHDTQDGKKYYFNSFFDDFLHLNVKFFILIKMTGFEQ